MIRTIRWFLGFEAAAFVLAALVHFGFLLHGYEHSKAPIAESIIGGVLFVGFVATFIRPQRAFTIARGAQLFGLIGTCVGLFTIAVGIGPRTGPDLFFHAGILTTLIAGLISTRRLGKRPRPRMPQ